MAQSCKALSRTITNDMADCGHKTAIRFYLVADVAECQRAREVPYRPMHRPATHQIAMIMIRLTSPSEK
jgi:hypothetical protein